MVVMKPTRHPSQLMYLWAADAIAARIATGYYDTQLPPERDLAAEFGISYVTVRRAMEVLRSRGLIISVHGRGTFLPPEGTGTS